MHTIADLDSRDVSIEALHALRVVVSSVTHCSIRSSHCQPATVVVTGRTVAVLGCFIHHLRRRRKGKSNITSRMVTIVGKRERSKEKMIELRQNQKADVCSIEARSRRLHGP